MRMGICNFIFVAIKNASKQHCAVLLEELISGMTLRRSSTGRPPVSNNFFPRRKDLMSRRYGVHLRRTPAIYNLYFFALILGGLNGLS